MASEEKKTRNRPKVLIPMKVSDLRKIVGDEAEVMVGRTRLAELLTERQIENLLGR